MAKLLRQNVGGVDYTMAGCALTGVCASAASDFIKVVALSDGDQLSDGMSVVVAFANGNTAGTAPLSKTIYSSDQVSYYTDEQLTVPFTLAPSGCYTIEYTGTGNAYTYQSYPVIVVGNVSGPLCDTRGKPAGGVLWDAGDIVTLLYTGGKFLVLNAISSAVRAGSPLAVSAGAVAATLKHYPDVTYYNSAQSENLDCNDITDRVCLVTALMNNWQDLHYPFQGIVFIITANNEGGSGFQKAISWGYDGTFPEYTRIRKNGVWQSWIKIASVNDVSANTTHLIPLRLSSQVTSYAQWERYLWLGVGFSDKYASFPEISGKTKKVHLIINAQTDANNLIIFGAKRQSDVSVTELFRQNVYGGVGDGSFSRQLQVTVDPTFLLPYTEFYFMSDTADVSVAVCYLFAEVYYE